MRENSTDRAGGRRHFPYKQIISLVLVLSLMFSLVAMPVQAATINNPAVAGKEFLSKLKEIISTAAAETGTETGTETETKSESESDPAPEPEPEVIKRTIQSLTVKSPEMTLVAVPGTDGILKAISASSSTGRLGYIDWTGIGYAHLDQIAHFNAAGELDGGIVHFMLNHDKYQTMTVKIGDNVCHIAGIKGFDELHDGDHNRICDDCGRCIGGCIGDVKTYTAEDVARRDENTGLLYDKDGNVIGSVVTMEMPVLCEKENGEFYVEVQTQTYDDFYSVSTDEDGKCNVCGSPLCGTPDSGYAHDFSDGFCDYCGTCSYGCNDGDEDDLCDKCGFCIEGCEDGNEDGICDECEKEMPCDVAVGHYDISGRTTCKNCSSAICTHMTNAEVNLAMINFQTLQYYLGLYLATLPEVKSDYDAKLYNWAASFFTPFATDAAYSGGIAYQDALRKSINQVPTVDSGYLLQYAALFQIDAAETSGADLIGTLNKDGTISNSGSRIERFRTLNADYLKAYDAAQDEVKPYYALKDSISDALPEQVTELAKRLLKLELNTVFGENYNGGAISITKDDRFALKAAVDSVEKILPVFLYEYNDEAYAELAKDVWNGKEALPENEKDRLCIMYAELALVDRALLDLGEGPFGRDFETVTYDNDGDAPYAVRTPVEKDMARRLGENYEVWDEQIQNVINAIDAYLSSEECAELLTVLLGDMIGTPKDVDEDGKIGLYDLAISVIRTRLLTEENVGMLFKLVFGSLTDILDRLPEILESLAPGIEMQTGKDRVFIDVCELIGGKIVDGKGSLIAELVSILGNTLTGNVRFNGMGDTRTFKEIFAESNIAIYPDQVAKVLKIYNEGGRYDSAIAALSKVKSWSEVEELTLGIDSEEGINEIVSVILACIDPLLKPLFGGTEGMYLNLKELAAAGINGTFALGPLQLPLFINLNLSATVEVGALDIYGKVMTPIFEALGVDPGDIDPPILSGDTYMRDVTDALLNPLRALLKHILDHPVASLLGALPNLALFIENGKLFDLLDINIPLSFKLYDVAPKASQLGENYLDMVEDSIFRHWYDYINPLKWAQFLEATALYWIVAPLFTLIVGKITKNGIDLIQLAIDLASIISVDANDLARERINKTLEKRPKQIDPIVNGLLDDAGLTSVRFSLPKMEWPETDYRLLSDGKELRYLNFSSYFAAELLGEKAESSMGFRLDDPISVITFILGCFYDKDGKQLFDIKALKDAMNFNELAHLGTVTVRDGSTRSADYYSHWNGLEKGQYYYVEADTSDVVFWLMKAAAGILGSAQNVNAILTLLGIDDNKVDTVLDGFAAKLNEVGFEPDLKALLVGYVDADRKLDFGDVCENINAGTLLCATVELFLSDKLYDMLEMEYTEAEAERAAEIAARGSLPYLDYDNLWSESLAGLLSDDVDDLANKLIKVLGVDLDEAHEGTETVQEFAETLINSALSDPGLLELVVRLITSVMSDIAANGTLTRLVQLSTGIDISAWSNDFGYLFDDSKEAPEERYFDRIFAEKTDDKIVWYLDGSVIDSSDELLTALTQLLLPLEPVLDLILCGGKLNILPYTRYGRGYVSGSVMTVSGGEGYNSVIIPLLEAAFGENSDSIPTAAEFKEMGSAAGLCACIKLALNFVTDKLLHSDTPVGDLMEMAAQLMYAMSDKNMTVAMTEMMRPLWVTIDIIRPVAQFDINGTLNEFICQFGWKLGNYSSADELRTVMKASNAAIDLKALTPESILGVIECLLSAVKDGERVFPQLEAVYYSAIRDLACLRKSYTSQSVKTEAGLLTDEHIKAYRLDIRGADAMTAIFSMFAEMFVCGDNAYAIDKALGLKGLLIAAKTLLTEKPVYNTDYDWAYIVGDDAAAKAEFLSTVKKNGSVAVNSHKLRSDRENFEKYLETYGLTDWDEPLAESLMTELDDVLSGLLNLNIGGTALIETVLPEEMLMKTNGMYTVGSVLRGIILSFTTDGNIDKLIYRVSDILCAMSEPKGAKQLAGELAEIMGLDPAQAADIAELLPMIKNLIGALGIDPGFYEAEETLTVYENGKVTYYNADGEKTGLVRETVKPDGSNLGAVFADVLAPLSDIICFALIGKPIEIFNASTNLVNGRGEALIRVPGTRLYNYLALPVMEAMGVTGLRPEAYYVEGDAYKTDEFMHDFFGAVSAELMYLVSDKNSTQILDKLIDMLPAFIYLTNADGVGVTAKNLLAPFEPLVSMANSALSIAGMEDLSFDLENVKALFADFGIGDMIRLLFSWTAIEDDNAINSAAASLLGAVLNVLKGVPADKAGSTDGHHLVLDDFFYELYNNFTVGEIVYNASSACDYETYTMRFASARDKADLLTILISSVIDIIESPDNEAALTAVLGKCVYQSMINLFNMSAFEFKPFDIGWLFTEYADSGKLVSAFELSDKLRTEPVYGNLWTPEKAQELANDLDGFLEDMLYLLGLEINGIKIRDFASLSGAILNGVLYNNDTVNALAKVLGGVKTYLDKYDPDGAIADFVMNVLEIDLHAWDDYAPGEKYGNGRDWGFNKNDLSPAGVEKNAAVFENAISELLAPAAPVLAFVLAGRDYSFYVDGDGLGKNAENIQLTVIGAEGYKYGIVPLLEAIGVDTDDIYDPDEYSARAVKDNTYAIKGIIHPVIAKLNEIGSNTLQEFFELIPEVIYFLNCGGFGNMLENLLHSVYVVGNALSPMKEQISQFAYDENGIFDLYNTLNITKLVDDALFDAFGIEKDDLVRVYNASGGNYEEVKSFEDVDLRLIMSVVFALADSMLGDAGLDLVLMPYAANLVNELSYGYLVSFDSKTGREAYKMELGEDVSPQALGDLFTILMRVVLSTLAQGNNVDAVMHLLKLDTDMDSIDYTVVYALLRLIAVTTAESESIQGAMMIVYYTVHGASTVSGLTVKEYSKLNTKWAALMTKLATKNDGIAGMIFKAILEVAGDALDDVVDTHEVAPHGFIAFFRDAIGVISSFFQTVKNAVTGIFKGILKC